MNGNFIKLLEQLELEQKKDTYQGTLKDIIVNKADHSWFFDIELQRPLDIEDFKELKEKIEGLSSKVRGVNNVTFNIVYKENDFSLLPDYYDVVLKKLSEKKPRFSSILDFDIDVINNRIEVLCPKDGTFVSDLLYEVKAELLKIKQAQKSMDKKARFFTIDNLIP